MTMSNSEARKHLDPEPEATEDQLLAELTRLRAGIKFVADALNAARITRGDARDALRALLGGAR